MLSVRRGAQAVEFYKVAFGGIEVFRIESPDGAVVARLSVEGAEFWVADESPEHHNFSPESLGGGSVRMVLTIRRSRRDVRESGQRGSNGDRSRAGRLRMAAWACGRSVWPPLGNRPATRQLTPSHRSVATAPLPLGFLHKLSHLAIESSHPPACALHDPGGTATHHRRFWTRREQQQGSTDLNRAHRGNQR